MKHKTITNLANITGIKWWFYIDIYTLIHQNSKAKRDYMSSKKNSYMLREEYIKERAKQMVLLVNIKEDSRLQKLITIEKII